HPHLNSSGVPRALRLGSLSLSPLPQHARVARTRPDVSVFDQASAAGRSAAVLAKGVGQCAAQRSDAHNRRRRQCLITGLTHTAARAASRGGHRRRVGRMALLRAAHFPGYVLEPPKLMELQSSRNRGQLPLRSAADPAMVHRQYWLPPYPPSGAAHSELSAACSVRIESTAAVCATSDP